MRPEIKFQIVILNITAHSGTETTKQRRRGSLFRETLTAAVVGGFVCRSVRGS